MSNNDPDNTVFTALLVLACLGGVSWLAFLAWVLN